MTNHLPSSTRLRFQTLRMNAFDDLRKEARNVVARGLARQGSLLSLEENRRATIRQEISLVTIRDNLIELGLGKTLAVRPQHVHKISLGTVLIVPIRTSRASSSPKHVFGHVLARCWRQMTRLLFLNCMTGSQLSFFQETSLLAGPSMSKAWIP